MFFGRFRQPTPQLSIVVIFYNMRREAKRTLYTLSSKYQRGVSAKDYEVIVIDNDSTESLEKDFVTSFGDNFKYHYYKSNSCSPAAAVNKGIDLARGKYVGCIVDGARMQSPQLVLYTLRASNAFSNPFICTLAWHLGDKEQNLSLLEGYNQESEDQLLKSINWRENGYELFNISSIAPSSTMGVFGGVPQECSYFAIAKNEFLRVGKFNELFRSPGGGLVNHEFLQRIVRDGTFELVILHSEGSFHQFHGGVATNVAPKNHPWQKFADEYESIHDSAFKTLKQPLDTKVHYLGSIPDSLKKFITKQ